MDNDNKHDKGFFDDVAEMTRSAFAGAAGIKRDLMSFVKHHVEDMIRKMNFVRRDEFNALKRIVMQNQEELEKILSRPSAEPEEKARKEYKRPYSDNNEGARPYKPTGFKASSGNRSNYGRNKEADEEGSRRPYRASGSKTGSWEGTGAPRSRPRSEESGEGGRPARPYRPSGTKTGSWEGAGAPRSRPRSEESGERPARPYRASAGNKTKSPQSNPLGMPKKSESNEKTD